MGYQQPWMISIDKVGLSNSLNRSAGLLGGSLCFLSFLSYPRLALELTLQLKMTLNYDFVLSLISQMLRRAPPHLENNRFGCLFILYLFTNGCVCVHQRTLWRSLFFLLCGFQGLSSGIVPGRGGKCCLYLLKPSHLHTINYFNHRNNHFWERGREGRKGIIVFSIISIFFCPKQCNGSKSGNWDKL